MPNRIAPYQFEPRYNEEQLAERRRLRALREAAEGGDADAMQARRQQQHGDLGERDEELQNRLDGELLYWHGPSSEPHFFR